MKKCHKTHYFQKSSVVLGIENNIFNRTKWLPNTNRITGTIREARGDVSSRFPLWVRASFSRNKPGTAALLFDHRNAVFTSHTEDLALSATRSFLIQFLIPPERTAESFWERKRCWQLMHERKRRVKSAVYWISHAEVRVNISCVWRISEFPQCSVEFGDDLNNMAFIFH